MGWFSSVPILLLVLFLLQVVQSIGTNDSAHMQEMAGANKMISNKRSGGGRSGGGRSGGGGRGGSSDNGAGGGGGRGGSSDNGGGSDGNSNTPDGRLIPLIGGGLAGSRNGAAAGHRNHNAASSTCSFFLPTLLSTTALEAVFLAL